MKGSEEGTPCRLREKEREREREREKDRQWNVNGALAGHLIADYSVQFATIIIISDRKAILSPASLIQPSLLAASYEIDMKTGTPRS